MQMCHELRLVRIFIDVTQQEFFRSHPVAWTTTLGESYCTHVGAGSWNISEPNRPRWHLLGDPQRWRSVVRQGSFIFSDPSRGTKVVLTVCSCGYTSSSEGPRNQGLETIITTEIFDLFVFEPAWINMFILERT